MVTKRELSAVLQKNEGMSAPVADRVLNMVFDEIMDRVKTELTDKGVSMIEGFGTITQTNEMGANLQQRGIRKAGVRKVTTISFDRLAY